MLSIYPSIKGGTGGGGGGGGCSFKARIDRSIIVKDLSLGWKKKLEDKKINGGNKWGNKSIPYWKFYNYAKYFA